MGKKVDTHPAFEAMAREFLAVQPEIPHTWRQIEGRWSRTDLVCWPDTANEVFATLRNAHITVGTNNDDTDFEDFGRGLTDEELAREAFSLFVDLIRQHQLGPKSQHE